MTKITYYLRNISNGKVFLLFLLFWFGFLAITGTLNSGYHFTDDHDVLRIERDLSDTTIGREVGLFFKDLFQSKMRFRPFYTLHRRIATALLGPNFFAWSVYTGLMAILTAFFLYLFMRKTGYTLLESMLFAFLTQLGHQAAIWWKLGANETLGMFVLSASMLLMAQSVFAKKNKLIYRLLFIVTAVLATWSKESFVLMLPALVLWRIYLTREAEEVSLKEAIKRNVITGGLLLAVCLAEVGHIVFRVGTTGIQYAGYEGFKPSVFIKTALAGFMAVQGWVLVLLLGLCAVAAYRGSKRTGKSIGSGDFSFLWWQTLIAAFIIGPQVVLYMKSGMMERYLLPGVMGYTFLMVVLLRFLREKMIPTANRNVVFSLKRPLQATAILLLAVVALQGLRVSRYTAIAFAEEGRGTNDWFQSIRRNTAPQDLLLVVTDTGRYYEPAVSLKTYLDIAMDRENTLFTPTTLDIRPIANPYWQRLNRRFFRKNPDFRLDQPEARQRIRAFLLFPELEQHFLQSARQWFEPSAYTRYTYKSGYVAYFGK
jgi:hypothetical protein